MSNIDETLAERGNRYGKFEGHAYITQNIKTAMANSDNWGILEDDTKECLEMIAHKIGRILNGDPSYADNFTDICGYSRLVEKRLLAQAECDKVVAPKKGPMAPDVKFEDIAEALSVLMRAGVIRQTDDDGDD